MGCMLSKIWHIGGLHKQFTPVTIHARQQMLTPAIRRGRHAYASLFSIDRCVPTYVSLLSTLTAGPPACRSSAFRRRLGATHSHAMRLVQPCNAVAAEITLSSTTKQWYMRIPCTSGICGYTTCAHTGSIAFGFATPAYNESSRAFVPAAI